MLRSALCRVLSGGAFSRSGLVGVRRSLQPGQLSYCTTVNEDGEIMSVGGAPLDPDDPEDMIGFFDMVGLFYEQAASRLEPHLAAQLKGRDPIQVRSHPCSFSTVGQRPLRATFSSPLILGNRAETPSSYVLISTHSQQ